MKRLLLAGGGTGGHLFPAMAVGEAWRRAFGDQAELLFVGTADRIEARAVPEAGERLETIDATGIVGLRGWRKLLGVMRLPFALFQAIRIVRGFRPDVVVGAGGFVSGPTVLAAWLLGIPTAILEQNAMPGVTNRILGRLVKRVFTHFEQCEDWFAGSKIRRFGNPVRQAQLEALEAMGDAEAHAEVRLLMMGGSQGSKALNDGLPVALARLDEGLRQRLTVVHQCGKQGDVEAISAAYAEAGISAEVLPFMRNMAERYAWADLCICRSGAMTVCELAIAGRPAIFVPFPQATHDHQRHNAMELVRVGAAKIVSQKDLVEGLGLTVSDLLRDEEAFQEMGSLARKEARPEAARQIVSELADLIGCTREVSWA